MKRFSVFMAALVIILALSIPFSSCKNTPQTSSSTTTNTITSSMGEVALSVSNGSKTTIYTMSQIQSMKATTGWGAQYTMHGNAGPDQYTGVKVADFLKVVGGITSAQSVKFTAGDDYSRTLSYSQVVDGTFSLQDESGNSVAALTTPELAVLYLKNGAALDDTTGPLLLGILCDKSQFSGGSTWIKKIAKIEVVTAQ